ncbi:MAG: Flp family type IVb pilin [Actinomycetes bacterium]
MDRATDLYIKSRNAVAAKASAEDGATAVEYGLLVALIAAVIVAVVTLLGAGINNAFQTVVDAI